jgi:hypothetical protein
VPLRAVVVTGVDRHRPDAWWLRSRQARTCWAQQLAARRTGTFQHQGRAHRARRHQDAHLESRLATGEEVQSRSPESNVRYAKQLEAGTRVGKRLAASGSIPRVPAKVILEALLSEDPAPRQVVGREAKVIGRRWCGSYHSERSTVSPAVRRPDGPLSCRSLPWHAPGSSRTGSCPGTAGGSPPRSRTRRQGRSR